jgi:hypothetical protein
MRLSRSARDAMRVSALVLLAFVAGCTSGTDATDPSTKAAAGPDSAATTAPRDTRTASAPVPRNGQITSAERYLSGNARAYQWRSFDPVSETGLFVTGAERHRSYGFDGLGVVAPTGPVATLTCAHDLPCSREDDWLSYTATLGPGADEVTVKSGDGTVQVIGYDGTLRRTLDLGATITGGGEVWGLRWSADGSRLAVVTTSHPAEGVTVSRVWLVDGDGDDAQLAYSLRLDASGLSSDTSDFDGEGAVFNASAWGWSPDGQSLLLDQYLGRTYGADVVVLHLQPDSAAVPVIARTLYHSDRHFDWAGNVAWSPDGTRIAVRTSHHITEISARDGSVVARHPHNPGWLIWRIQEGRDGS